MLCFLRRFERYVVLSLLAMMVVVVFLGTVELAVILVEEIINSPKLILLDITEMFTLFGFFLMILIGLELIEVIKIYLVENAVHCEIVLLVAIIAITRKIIILDIKQTYPLTLIGIAAVVLALSAGYFLLKKSLRARNI